MKRPFLLLELLIAFSLVTIFAFPLIFNPLNRLNKELGKLEQIETERLSELLLSEVKENLYLNKVPWKKIPTKKPKVPFQEFKAQDYTFSLGDIKKLRNVHFDIFLYWDKAPLKDKGGREFGVLNCDLITKKATYNHKIFLFSYEGTQLL